MGKSQPDERRGRGRPRASLACSACRIRKTKCDFLKSNDGNCSYCRSAGVECINKNRDHRKKNDQTDAILRLTSRLESIESALIQNTTGDTESNHLDNPYLSTAPIVEDPFLASSTMLSNMWDTMPIALELGDCQVLGGDESSHEAISVPDDHAQKGTHEAEIMDDSGTDVFWSFGSKRFPRVALSMGVVDTAPETPSPRSLEAFYGPTSMIRHLSIYGSTTSDDCELDSPGPMEIDIDSEGIRRSILIGFWKFNESWTSIVDSDMFQRYKALGIPSEYYSRFLEDAMLACGSRHSSSAIIRSTGKLFAHRAKAALIRQLQTPTIASIQGVLLLSAFEGTSGHPSFGWTLCGIAIRLLFDLGIHQDSAYLIQNRGFSAADLSLIQTLFLTMFCIDTVYAWFMGRPRSAPVPIAERVLANKTSGTTRDLTAITLIAWSELCIEAARAQDIINNGQELDDRAMEQLSSIKHSLQQWYEALPPELAWNDINIPALSPSAYGLHAEYCGIQIALHTLSSKSDVTASTPPQGSNIVTLPGFTTQQSRKLACKNAIQIAQLAQTLDHVYGSEEIITALLCNIFSAGMALIQCWGPDMDPKSTSGPVKEKTALAVLFQTLEDVSRHYPLANRISLALAQQLVDQPLGN